MKICQEEGCNNEIEAWQTYCQKHYAIKMQEAQQNKIQQPPDIPEPPVRPKVVQEQEKKVLPEEKEPLPEIDERTASIVSQVAFKGAIEIMSNMPFEEKTFEELIGEIRTLTNEFYRIIVEERR